MDVAAWQKRLEENFTEHGVVGGHLLEIIDMERAYGEYFVNTYHGQAVLIDSFQSFYIETLQVAQNWVASNGWPKDAPNYAPILLFYVTNFRSFRACENLLTSGYPLDGYALLRDIKDRATFLGGIAHNITSFPKIYGYATMKEASDEEWSRIRKERKKEESCVLNRMVRKGSGMPDNVIEELKKWEQLFNEEVHGSKFTLFTEGVDWIRGKELLTIGPVPKESSMAMYMNRSAEIGSLLVRLLPFLQPVENAFGSVWKERHYILDDSFRIMVDTLSKLGKHIADAFIYFVDNKFTFPDGFHYLEADGSG
jgi:hypothetical protein